MSNPNAAQLAKDFITNEFSFEVDFGDVSEYLYDVVEDLGDDDMDDLAEEVTTHIQGELDTMYQRWLDQDS